MNRETQCAKLRIALAKQIRSVRARRGISQEELAFLADLHRTYISLVERSKKSLTVDSLARIAAALDIKPSKLLASAEKRSSAKGGGKMSRDSTRQPHKAEPFPMNSREPLAPAEILELDHALTNVFGMIRETRELNPVARHIKFPSLPAVFSESIVIAAATVLFGPSWKCRYGGKESDLILESTHGTQTKRVEVKATGQHALQELKAKDLRADVLVWVRFGRRYEVGGGGD